MKKLLKKALSLSIAIILTLSIIPAGTFTNLSMKASAATNVVTITSPQNESHIDYDNPGRATWTCSNSSVTYYRYSLALVKGNNDVVERLAVNVLTTKKYFYLSDYDIEISKRYKLWVGPCIGTGENDALPGDGGTIIYFDTMTAPTVSTGEASSVGTTYATLNGSLDKNGGEDVTDYGFVVSKSRSNLTIEKGMKYSKGQGKDFKGNYSINVTDLERNTKYYFTSYATNCVGTSYDGSDYFTTTCEHPSSHDSIVSLAYKSISDTEHSQTAEYNKVCDYCYEVIESNYKTETTTEYHEFDSAGICVDCHHAKDCPHTNTSKEYYDERYNCKNETYHEYVHYYRIVCDNCDAVVDSKVMWDTTQKEHTFSGNKCSKCGYVKNAELSVSITPRSTTGSVDSIIGADATATGGAGGYKYAYTVYKDSTEVGWLEFSDNLTYYSHTPKECGTYYFKVMVRDSAGKTVTATSTAIVVKCSHETYSRDMFTITKTNQEYEQYNNTYHYVTNYYSWQCTICNEIYKNNEPDSAGRTTEEHTFESDGTICTKCGAICDCPHEEFDRTDKYTIVNTGNPTQHTVNATYTYKCKNSKCNYSYTQTQTYTEPHEGNGGVSLSNGGYVCSCQYEAGLSTGNVYKYALKDEHVYSTLPNYANRKYVGVVYGNTSEHNADKVLILGETQNKKYTYIEYSTTNGSKKRAFITSSNLFQSYSDLRFIGRKPNNQIIEYNKMYSTGLYAEVYDMTSALNGSCEKETDKRYKVRIFDYYIIFDATNLNSGNSFNVEVFKGGFKGSPSAVFYSNSFGVFEQGQLFGNVELFARIGNMKLSPNSVIGSFYQYESTDTNSIENYHDGINVFSSQKVLCVCMGESLTLAVCSVKNGKKNPDLSSLAFTYESKGNISISRNNNDANGLCYITITGKTTGTSILQINDTDTGETIKLSIGVISPKYNAFTTTTVPVVGIRNEHKLNFYNYSGLNIDDFACTKTTSNENRITFNVFNTLDTYGAVFAYAADGSIYDVALIKKHKSYSDSLYSGLIDEPFKLVADAINGDIFSYRQEGGYSEKTHIVIDVPDGGYIKITNNTATSGVVCLLNVLDIFFSVKEILGEFTTSEGSSWDEVKDTCLLELLERFLKNNELKVIEEFKTKLLQNAIEGIVFNKESIIHAYEQLTAFLANLPDKVLNTICDSGAEISINMVQDVFQEFAGPAGEVMKAAFLYNSIFNIYETFDAMKKTSGIEAIKIQVPNNSNTIALNDEVTVTKPTAFDNETVMETYMLSLEDGVTNTIQYIVEASPYVQSICRNNNISPDQYFEENAYRLYDITMIRSGEVCQPNSEMTVLLNIPPEMREKDNWHNKIKVYRVETDGTLTDMKAKYSNSDDMISFDTNHFSLYLVISEDPNAHPFPTVEINNSTGTKSINYGDTLQLTAVTTDMPAGAKVVWSVQGTGVSLNASADGKTCDITSTASGTVTVTAKIVDANGNPITDANDNEITSSQQIKSNAGFFQKLIAFFKKLFGSTKIVVQAIDE